MLLAVKSPYTFTWRMHKANAEWKKRSLLSRDKFDDLWGRDAG
jgi:hypothetical protein